MFWSLGGMPQRTGPELLFAKSTQKVQILLEMIRIGGVDRFVVGFLWLRYCRDLHSPLCEDATRLREVGFEMKKAPMA